MKHLERVMLWGMVIFFTVHLFTDSHRHLDLVKSVNSNKVEINVIKNAPTEYQEANKIFKDFIKAIKD